MFRITPQPGVDHEEAAAADRRRKLHGDMDGGVDRPADRLRALPRQGVQIRAGAEHRPRHQDRAAVLRLHRLRPRSVRAGLDRQPDRLDHRQRLRLQGGQGLAAGGHAHSGRLPEDVPGAGDRHRRRARAARQVRPAAARRHDEAEARPVRTQLRPRRLRGAEGRARLRQGRREHQLAALHALARPLPLLHGGGEQGVGRHRRGQGPLSQRHRRHDGGDVRARRVRQAARLLHRHDRSRHRLHGDPVDGQMGAPQRHDPAPASRRQLDLFAPEEPRHEFPRHLQVDAHGGRRPHPCRHGRRQARGRSADDQGISTTRCARSARRRTSRPACSSTRNGLRSTR